MKIEGFDVLDEDVTPSQINVSSLILKKELNPLVWENEALRADVRDYICPIIDSYFEYVTRDIGDVEVLDVYFTGSLANYNWSNYSDFDIHIVADYSKINEDVELVSKYFKDRSELYSIKNKHCLGKFDIELNMNDVVELRANAGVWSISNNDWVQKPNIDEISIDYDSVKDKTSKIINSIDTNSDDVSALIAIKKKISKMRNASLEKDGEFATENLVFKLIRRSGYLQKLKDLINGLQ